MFTMNFRKYFSKNILNTVSEESLKPETGRDKIVSLIRYIITFILILFLAQTVELQINTFLLILSSALGLYVSKRALVKNHVKKSLILNLLLLLGLELALRLFQSSTWLISSTAWFDLHPSVLKDKISFLSLVYLVFYIENTCFWKIFSMLTLEVVSASFLLITALSGHRNYKIDIPNTISSLTWKLDSLQGLNIDPEELLVAIAFFFCVISIIYILLSSSRTIYSRYSPNITFGKKQIGLSFISIGLLIVGFFFLARGILSSYSKDLQQTSNGVGSSQGTSQGKSNLGFNKASTPSKQPAALVRLQNNYDANPWKPMMYFREGALSEYDGKEIVKASSEFDTDAPVVNSSSPLLINPPLDKDDREEINQAVYILSDKATPLALDAPIQFKPIKNPNPKRFKSSYLVKSLAPVKPLNEILDAQVGEDNWTKEIWDHYLKAPGSDLKQADTQSNSTPTSQSPISQANDIRYAKLSKELTKDSANYYDSITKIISYLSKESIYVLEPKHELPTNGDPVAPYLFAEQKRGYCVHFAHAASYLLRLAGIPARIGTGYLVDLQYAKGGDILVQMADRHAWPEVYIRGRGWVVVDVTPAKAENDQVTVPDQSLLEELMSEIDPIEEIPDAKLPEDFEDKERLSPLESFLKLNITSYIKYPLLIFLLLSIILKLWLRHAWRFTSNNNTKIKRLHLATSSLSEDLFYKRNYGETLTEFANRLEQEKDFHSKKLIQSYIKVVYDNENSNTENSAHELAKSVKSSFKTLKDKLILVLSYFNPSSLISFLQKKSKFFSLVLILGLNTFLLPASNVKCQDSAGQDNTNLEESSNSQSIEEIIQEATVLFKEGKGIDARSKLENALTTNPEEYRLFLLLGQYYLAEVSHFKLAYKYIAKAKKLFEEKKLNNRDRSSLADEYGFQNQHALILYLLSESELSLDRYEDSLKTLDEYSELYQGDWFPGQKAWVLMKLKRIPEAINVAKNGLLSGADPKRTWNILGILLSISGERELSLQAFGKAVEYEYRLSVQPQVATPINNAGEVYREIFKDDYAESAWRSALKFPDGCDHILPSVNLSILYTDQLRLFAAERALSDFEACYANKPEKKDSEHRTIMALARSKLNLLYNDIPEAERLITISSDDQQWFGKIGTNENDIKFSSWITASEIEKLKSEFILEKIEENLYQYPINYLKALKSRFSSWWILRKAKLFAVTELEDFEDLSVRHSDTMLTYPLLGEVVSSFGLNSAMLRLNRLIESDKRDGAINYYNTYLALLKFKNGDYQESITLAESVLKKIPAHERLLKAELLSIIIRAKIDKEFSFPGHKFISSLISKNLGETDNLRLIEELYSLIPGYLRIKNIRLPVSLEVMGSNEKNLKFIKNSIDQRRFLYLSDSANEKPRYKILINSNTPATIQFYDTKTNQLLVSEQIDIEKPDKTKNSNLSELINEFNKKVFTYRQDGEAMSLPAIPFIEKYFRN